MCTRRFRERHDLVFYRPRPHYPTRWSIPLREAQYESCSFEIDVLVCPHCGAARKLIALISAGPVVRKILTHRGIETEPPPIAPARVPPELEFAW